MMTGHSEAGSAAEVGQQARRSAVITFGLRIRDALRIALPVVALTAIALVGEAGRRWNG
jgi:hypothetical protein